jgi:class 3 adenylate cyclase/predicted ATPase
MLCGNCGTSNLSTAKFCLECGAELSHACTNCGVALPAGAKFCSECGTRTETSEVTGTRPGSPQERPATPVAERRLVSIVFADLVGFTTLAEGRDAEETRDLLSRYFDLAREIIERYGGTVEKFIGDAVMAVWGAPVAHENDSERAVRAALDLVSGIPTLAAGLEARAAVLTGETAVTLGATNQGIVAGDLVNTASRLQSVAPSGTVLVDEVTQRATNAAIVFEPVGDKQLKGKVAPVAAYRALRVIAERGGRGRADRLEAPLIAREEEFRLLKELFHATSREKRPRLVSISGQAGVGKSRLVSELSRYVDGIVDTVYWHSGRSPAYGEGIAFWALGEMVRGRAGLAETDDDATTRTKVTQMVQTWIVDEEERAWIGNALLVLLGVEGSTKSTREELYSAWRTFFERIAASGTVVLHFEDLEWADGGLLDFIDHMLDWSRRVPLLIITLSRPELLERRPGWGGGRRNFVSLALEPLPEPAMLELLGGLVPGLPDRAAHSIVSRADGIPLYAMETVRMLIADGKLVQAGGAYQPSADLSSIAVPETLQALIASRLDSLEPVERSLMQDAAVLGQSFTVASLAAVSSLDLSTVEDHLRSLARREMLVFESDPRSPERGQYAFVQALIREVAYGTLAKPERRSRHLAAARYFESLGDEELAGALAAHYLAAYRASASGPEAQALAAQARIALKAAATRTSSLGSHEQASAYFLEAAEVTDDPTDEAELLERAGEAASVSGHLQAAETHLRNAIARRRDLGDRPGTARALGMLGRALASQRPDIVIELLEPAAVEFADLGDNSGLAMLEHQLARGYWLTAKRDEAIVLADRALGRAERLNDVPLIADALISKGALIGMSGRAYEGSASLRAGQALAEANGLSLTAIRGLINLSAAEFGRDPRLGLEAARQAMTMARRLGFRSSLAIAAGNALEGAARMGEWDWVLAEGQRLLEEDLEEGDRYNVVRGVEEVMAYRGDPVDQLLADHREHAMASGNPTTISNYHGALAARQFAQGDYGAAASSWAKSAELNTTNFAVDIPRAARAEVWARDVASAQAYLDRYEEQKIHGPEGDAARATIRAGIAALTGNRDEALTMYAEAIDRWGEYGVEFERALVGVQMALTLDPADPAVVSAVEDARVVLEKLQAAPLLALIDKHVGARGADRSAATEPPVAIAAEKAPAPALDVPAA